MQVERRLAWRTIACHQRTNRSWLRLLEQGQKVSLLLRSVPVECRLSSAPPISMDLLSTVRASLASVESRIAFCAEAIKSGSGVPVIKLHCAAFSWHHIGVIATVSSSRAEKPSRRPGTDSIPPNGDGFTGSKTSERPAWPRIATIPVADAEIGVGIVSIPAPLIEDPRQRHIASFKRFGGRLLSLSDRSNEPCE